MTIEKLSSKICQILAMHIIVMIALLPIPIKNRNIPQRPLHKHRQTKREVVNDVLWWVLHPLTSERNHGAERGYYNVLCADGIFKGSKLVLAASHPDFPEYRNLHHLQRHGCVCRVNNGCMYPASGPCSGRKNLWVRFQNRPKIRPAVCWRAKP